MGTAKELAFQGRRTPFEEWVLTTVQLFLLYYQTAVEGSMNALAAAHISSGMKLTRPADGTASKPAKLGHRRYASEPPPRTALSGLLVERELPSGYKSDPEEPEVAETPYELDSAVPNVSTSAIAMMAEMQPVVAAEAVTRKGKQRNRPGHSRASSDGASFLAACARRISGIRPLG